MTIGESIKKYRKLKGLKQSELAELANISRVAIGNYERGDRIPNIDKLNSISSSLQIPVGMLLEDPLQTITDNNSNIIGFSTKDGRVFNSIEDFLKAINEMDSSENLIKNDIGIQFENEAIVFLLEYMNRYDVVENLDNKTSKYLLMKVCDLLEFELFKLDRKNEEDNE